MLEVLFSEALDPVRGHECRDLIKTLSNRFEVLAVGPEFEDQHDCLLLIVERQGELEQCLDLRLENGVVHAGLLAQQRDEDECLVLPELVLLTDEPVEEGLKGVENANVKGRVRGLGQLDVAPLEEDIKDLLEHLRLGRDQTDDLLRDLDVLVEVLREHLFADFVAEDGFALHFDAIDLVGLKLFMHPSDLCILLRPFLLASRVDREPLFFRGRLRFKRRGGRGRLRHLALR